MTKLSCQPIQITQSKFHCCNQALSTSTSNGVHDITDEQKVLAEQIALYHPERLANDISRHVLKELVNVKYKDVPTINLNYEQLKAYVYKARSADTGGWETKLMSPPLSLCSESDAREFIQFNCKKRIGGKLLHMVGWGHPDIIFHLRGGPMNAAFPSAHPTMPQFITVIKNLCNTYVSDFNNIQTGNREPQVHQDAQVCPIPAGYEILKQATLQAAHVGTVAPVAEAPTDVDTETEDDDDDVPARPVRKKHRADRFDEINF